MRQGFILEGGHLGTQRPWAIPAEKITTVDDRTFFIASKSDLDLRRFLGLKSKRPWAKCGVLDELVQVSTKRQAEWRKIW